ncbi:MAG: DUF308 domain-containing protein [Solirubrobacterales bacterium]|nr:DUF308 domain-containing protein [Solirubrobacterales bacterium]
MTIIPIEATEQHMEDPLLTREQLRDVTREVTWAWWVLILAGVLGVIAGIIVIAKPGDSLTTLAVIVGVFILVDSILELIVGLFGQGGAMVALLGILGIVVGILLIRHPVHGVLAVALLVGIWLVALGVLRLVRAFAADRHLWTIAVAVLEIIAGIVIVSSPHIGFATLAILVGISFILNGFGMIALGWALRLVRREADHLASGPAGSAGTSLSNP